MSDTDVCELVLPCGRKTLLDRSDYERVKGKFLWRARKAKSGAYYVKGGPGRCLARYILGMPSGPHIDHINGDSLDNRRINLRPCTHSQNQWNRKRAPGISRLKGATHFKNHPSTCRWMSRITKNGKRKLLGFFPSALMAALAYDDAAYAIHGEYAGLNFPERYQESRQWLASKVLLGQTN